MLLNDGRRVGKGMRGDGVLRWRGTGQVSSHSMEENAGLEFTLVYGGIPEDAPGEPAQQLARKLKLPVALRFLPSLQVALHPHLPLHPLY